MQSIENIRRIIIDNSLDAILLISAENTAYMTGVSGFEGVVFITKHGKGYCFTDSRYIEIAKIKTLPIGYSTKTVPGNDYYKEINGICSSLGIKKIGYEDKSISVFEYKKIRRSIQCDLVGISDKMLDLRSVKSLFETENIIAAQRIAEKALDVLLGEIKPGMTENECKARLEYLMTMFGSERTSFPTILISGKKTSMPHGMPDNKIIEWGDFVTLDFGAVVNGYCSDMTRTIAIGNATYEMRKVYDIVLRANLAGVSAAAVGKTCSEVDKAAREIIDSEGYGENFGHALGHGVGIEIHEEPRVSPANHSILMDGNIITVEPGIYIPGCFGVRIEDMLFLKQDGNINLTNYSKKLIIL